jgi:hypothetical protein
VPHTPFIGARQHHQSTTNAEAADDQCDVFGRELRGCVLCCESRHHQSMYVGAALRSMNLLDSCGAAAAAAEAGSCDGSCLLAAKANSTLCHGMQPMHRPPAWALVGSQSQGDCKGAGCYLDQAPSQMTQSIRQSACPAQGRWKYPYGSQQDAQQTGNTRRRTTNEGNICIQAEQLADVQQGKMMGQARPRHQHQAAQDMTPVRPARRPAPAPLLHPMDALHGCCITQ